MAQTQARIVEILRLVIAPCVRVRGCMSAFYDQQFATGPGTEETARSEIAPYPEITAKRGV